MSAHERGALASTSVARHLGRGAIGFGLIGSAVALASSAGPGALLLAPLGMVALRGCPTCWLAGLLQTISAGRLRRSCGAEGCGLHVPRSPISPTETLGRTSDSRPVVSSDGAPSPGGGLCGGRRRL